MRCDAIGSHHCDNRKPQGHVEKCQRRKHGVYPPFMFRSPVRATLSVLCVVFCSGLPRSGTRVVLFVDGLSFVIRWNDHERSMSVQGTPSVQVESVPGNTFGARTKRLPGRAEPVATFIPASILYRPAYSGTGNSFR